MIISYKYYIYQLFHKAILFNKLCHFYNSSISMMQESPLRKRVRNREETNTKSVQPC